MVRNDIDEFVVEVSATRAGAVAAYAASVPVEQLAAYHEHTKVDPYGRPLPANHLDMDPEDFLELFMGERTDEGDDAVWGDGENFVLVGPRSLA